MTWDRYCESWMPLLDRALAAVILGWMELVKKSGLDWPTKNDDKELESPVVVARVLEQISKTLNDPKSAKLPRPAKGGDLYIQDELAGEIITSNLNDVGKYLRNAFQYLIQSPTIAKELDAAGEVALLGVGASIHAGLPKTETLFGKIKETLKAQASESFIELDKGNSQWNWAWRGTDIEELLSALQTSAWARRAFQQTTPSLEDKIIADLLCAYRSVIVAAQIDGPTEPMKCDLRDCIHPDPSTLQPEEVTRRFLEKFGECSIAHGNKRWAIISFNQDTVVESSLFEPSANSPPDNQDWSWKNGYGYIVSKSGLDDLYHDIHNHRIYKPHGTIAWYRTNAAFPQLGACCVEEATLHKSTLPNCSWKKKACREKPPLILVPSFFKDYEDKIIWDTIAKVCFELQNAKHIRIVGFRLRNDDTLMSHLIRLSLRNNLTAPDLHPIIELIGPDATSDTVGSLGRAWAPIMSDLAGRGWKIVRYPWRFHEYVLHNCWT